MYHNFQFQSKEIKKICLKSILDRVMFLRLFALDISYIILFKINKAKTLCPR